MRLYHQQNMDPAGRAAVGFSCDLTGTILLRFLSVAWRVSSDCDCWVRHVPPVGATRQVVALNEMGASLLDAEMQMAAVDGSAWHRPEQARAMF